MNANGHAARSAARGGRSEFDLLVDTNRGEHVARDRIQECPIEVAVWEAGDLQRKVSLDLDPQLTIMDCRAELLTHGFDRPADVTFVQLDALYGIRACGVPVAGDEMSHRPARDAREFRVVVFEALPQPGGDFHRDDRDIKKHG